MRNKFKVLALFFVICVMLNSSDFVMYAADVKDVEVAEIDDNATLWTGVDYAVPDVYLFEAGNYVAVGNNMIPYPSILRGHNLDEEWYGGAEVDFGCTVQSGYKYIFVYDNRYFPLFLDETEVEIDAGFEVKHFVSSYNRGFPFFNTLQEALEQADTIESNCNFNCPLDVYNDGSLVTYGNVYDRYNNSALIVQDFDGNIYRVCISDVFKYNLNSLTDYSYASKGGSDYITVEKMESLYNSEGACVGNLFRFSWEDVPTSYTMLYLEINDECRLIYNEDFATDDEKEFLSGKSFLDVPVNLSDGVYTWKLTIDGFSVVDNSVFPSVAEDGTLEVKGVDYIGDSYIKDEIDEQVNIEVSAIPDELFFGDILRITFTSNIPVVFEFNGETSIDPVLTWVYDCTDNMEGVWIARIGSSIVGRGELAVDCFKLATSYVDSSLEDDVNDVSSDSKLVQTGSEVWVYIVLLGGVIVVFGGYILWRYKRVRRDK